ncbi:uncharacterized protein LOC112961316 isoform X2 [Apteryx rowi]|uniref:uncharacterized protein LOC112961316 isoform X2 n=1 Tax=Apteryx rowi TaxID=308060 RepID=UPI000E1E028C|nr:uncharacterized protein LOC112961316 isoform X2 [Apteryx rowi]
MGGSGSIFISRKPRVRVPSSKAVAGPWGSARLEAGTVCVCDTCQGAGTGQSKQLGCSLGSVCSKQEEEEEEVMMGLRDSCLCIQQLPGWRRGKKGPLCRARSTGCLRPPMALGREWALRRLGRAEMLSRPRTGHGRMRLPAGSRGHGGMRSSVLETHSIVLAAPTRTCQRRAASPSAGAFSSDSGDRISWIFAPAAGEKTNCVPG